jgi:hypothetical protein
MKASLLLFIFQIRVASVGAQTIILPGKVVHNTQSPKAHTRIALSDEFGL